VRIGSANGSGWPHVGGAYGELDWGPGPFARVLLVAELETTCFPFDRWAANPPPAGQNWPADCDAFDRNFEIFLDDPGAAVPHALVHAVTPFGGPARFEVDVTDLANARPGGHRLRADLISYSDTAGQVTGSNGGWTVSAWFEVTPGAAPRRVLAALPLLATRITAADPAPTASWEVPSGTTSARLEYRTSGHGQGPADSRCVGPAEEFCDRRHLVFLDGAMIDNVEPYRTDCGDLCTLAHYGPADAGFDYCQENPCGAIASVRAPRANWCPGSATAPITWDGLPALAAAGAHTFSVQVSQIAEGGHWRMSAVYYAYGDGP
jgi:hypothetical protein